jgi:hypothetical protein
MTSMLSKCQLLYVREGETGRSSVFYAGTAQYGINKWHRGAFSYMENPGPFLLFSTHKKANAARAQNEHKLHPDALFTRIPNNPASLPPRRMQMCLHNNHNSQQFNGNQLTHPDGLGQPEEGGGTRKIGRRFEAVWVTLWRRQIPKSLAL